MDDRTAVAVSATFSSVLGQRATVTFESGGTHGRAVELTEDERLALEDLLTGMIDRRTTARHG